MKIRRQNKNRDIKSYLPVYYLLIAHVPAVVGVCVVVSIIVVVGEFVVVSASVVVCPVSCTAALVTCNVKTAFENIYFGHILPLFSGG